jgi:hypothetical protein
LRAKTGFLLGCLTLPLCSGCGDEETAAFPFFPINPPPVVGPVVNTRPTQLAVVNAPTNLVANVLFPLTVEARDASGQLSPTPLPVSISVLSGPQGGALVGNATATTAGGSATFQNLRFTVPGTYVLQVSAPDLEPVTVSLPVALFTFGSTVDQSAPDLRSLAVGRFNDDNRPDVVVSAGNTYSVLLSGGGRTDFVSPTTPGTQLATGNFDDGTGVDEFFAIQSINLLGVPSPSTVYRPDGQVAGSTGMAAGSPRARAAAVDVNGDGNLDVVTTSTITPASVNYSLAYALGDGSGGLGAPVVVASSGAPPYRGISAGPLGSFAIGNFDTNGLPDLAVASTVAPGTQRVVVHFNFGSPGRTSTVLTVGPTPRAVGSGHFNSDNLLDLVVADDDGNIRLLLSNGQGGFTESAAAAAGTQFPIDIAVGDLNSDGFQDVALAHVGSIISLMFGDGQGNFSQPEGIFAGGFNVEIADFNGDGRADLVAGSDTAANNVVRYFFQR